MTKNSDLVIQGYLDLTDAEQKDVDGALRELRLADGMVKRTAGKKTLNASHPRITMGPVSQGCPCCGR